MEYRLMKEADRPGITVLWGEVFEDGPEFVACCLDDLAGPGHVYVAEETGAVVAQLLAVPCSLEDEQGIYLYALATAPQCRGAGVMSGLMAYAEAVEAAGGAMLAMLVPAGKALFGYYGRRGYGVACRLRRLGLAPPLREDVAVECKPLDAGLLAVLRKKHADVPWLAFDAGRADLLLGDTKAAGGALVMCDEGYAVVKRKPDELAVPELFAKNDAAAERLVSAALACLGSATATVTVAANGRLFAERGVEVPFAMLKRLDGGPGMGDVYIRFGGG